MNCLTCEYVKDETLIHCETCKVMANPLSDESLKKDFGALALHDLNLRCALNEARTEIKILKERYEQTKRNAE